MKEAVERLLTEAEVLSIYKELIGQEKSLGNSQYTFSCPFHQDDTPSFSVNAKEMGVYRCFGCNEKGNIYTLLKKKGIDKPLLWLGKRFGIEPKAEEKKLVINDGEIYQNHLNLLSLPAKVQQLLSFGITTEIIKKRMIGFYRDRFWFPITDAVGDFVNVRMYGPGMKPKVMSYDKGFGEGRLYPIENLHSDTIYIMEGEKDMLAAESYGFNAITTTTGAGVWKDIWTKEFKNKNVIIVGDIDEPGCKGADMKAQTLYPVAGQVKVIKLPINPADIPNGDFVDYMTKCGGTAESFRNLVAETSPYVPEGIDAEEEIRCLLADATKPELINKKCYISNVSVCGRDRAPYSAPKTVKFVCSSGGEKSTCGGCSCMNGSYIHSFRKYDYPLIELIEVSSKYIPNILRKACNIRCVKNEYEILDYYTVDKLTLSPSTTYNIEEKFEYVNRTGLYVSDQQDPKVETNKCYDMKAITVPAPNTQALVHQVYWISQADSDIDNFKLTPEIESQLAAFRVETTIDDKLFAIYDEFSKMARIYGRQDLFFMYDLTYHSAISFQFQGQSIGKGWIESAVIGDSGTAKTSSAKFLIKYYHAGEIMDGETTTEVGLKGGLHQAGGRSWQLQWGRLPINDRRLVVIDEASGLDLEVIAALSNIRSSGECLIQKVVSDKTRSRTRIIWIANPRRNNTTIRNYTFGVDTIRDFFGKPEDVRRCDIAMTAASGEIPVSVINKHHDDIMPRYTSELCSLLVRFAWSRRSEDIYIMPDAEKLMLEEAMLMGENYSSMIPLVEASDIRNKIARMSVALAIRLFNVENGLVVVTNAHVTYICKWLRSMYSKPMFRYDAFSDKERRKTSLENKDLIIEALRLKENLMSSPPWSKYDALGNVNDLLDYSVMEANSLAMLAGIDSRTTEFSRILLKLKRCNAITMKGHNQIAINPSMIDWLREMQKELQSSDYKMPDAVPF